MLWSATTQYNLILKLFGLTKIPLLLFAGPSITVLNDEQVEVKIPLNWRTRNHLHSMYFGALAIGSDCAAGLLATKFIRESKSKVHLSFKNIKGEFLQRAQADVFFVNRQGRALKSFVQEVIDHPGQRKNFLVTVEGEVWDPEQQKRTKVAHFELTLSLKS